MDVLVNSAGVGGIPRLFIESAPGIKDAKAMRALFAAVASSNE